ncbi:hypothetical protein [Candidatus Cardinium hertigii]|uniref:RING-type domain-containing protein n=1 Tax=Candidatus Cardinium hertigii TaxID=247481 RepID=A0A2Z3L7F2_9BACT|nr:hypothetical protein [Candidatus Cardinium hertigii]AWN81563.1 hypothetical protein DK880_00231 [Candidatus Cardinium hertigii]
MQNLNFLKSITHLLLFSITILAGDCDLGEKEQERLMRAKISRGAFREAAGAEVRRRRESPSEAAAESPSEAAAESPSEAAAAESPSEAAESPSEAAAAESPSEAAAAEAAAAEAASEAAAAEAAAEAAAAEAASEAEVRRRRAAEVRRRREAAARHRREVAIRHLLTGIEAIETEEAMGRIIRRLAEIEAEIKAEEAAEAEVRRRRAAEVRRRRETVARRRREAAEIAARVSETKAEEILCAAEAAAKKEQTECAICLDQMDTEGQTLKRRIYLPIKSENVCAHAFHLGCLYELIIRASRTRTVPNDLYDCFCAVCRTPIPSENMEAIICIYRKYGGSF